MRGINKFLLTASLLASGLSTINAQSLVTAKTELEIKKLISKMTLKEKTSLLHGNSKFNVPGIKRLGIPATYLSDGPHSVREEVQLHSWAGMGWKDDYVTYLPVGVALSATWNRKLGELHGKVLGSEARHRNKDIILGPGFNIVRTPLCGRNFEYVGEDPYMISEMIVGIINEIQKNDVAACAKHYILNNQEWNRDRVDVDLSLRTLQEIYLPPFKASVQRANVWTIMGSYNKFRGDWVCENKYLLNDILRKELGFDGVVVTDWNAAHSTKKSVDARLDLEMGTNGKSYDNYYYANPLIDAVKNGSIDEKDVDVLVADRLRVMYASKMIGSEAKKRKKGSRNTKEHQNATLKIAEEAIVLLKNDNNVLPVDNNKYLNILVLGINADKKHADGGGSSKAKALYEVTPLEGLRRRAGNMAKIEYININKDANKILDIPSECLKSYNEKTGIPGWKMEFFNNMKLSGTPVQTKYTASIKYKWPKSPAKNVNSDKFSARITGKIQPAKSGKYDLIVKSDDGVRLYVDGKLVINNWRDQGPTARTFSTYLKANKVYDIKIEYYENAHSASLAFGWNLENHSENELAKLMKKAKKADIVLFFGGLNHSGGGDREGGDRRHLKLPKAQNNLIQSLSKVNKNLAVFLTIGSAIEMPWKNDVSAIAVNWYAGMEGGNAIANVIFGDVNPSGKLPITFPKSLKDTPASVKGEYNPHKTFYNEGIFVGYRWYEKNSIDVLFPFGHGLSYTKFKYSNIKITKLKDNKVGVKVIVENCGKIKGAEVVQLYVADKKSTVVRPVKELKGFEKVMLAPQESKEINFTLDKSSFSFFDEKNNCWKAENGEFEILIGSSSADIRQKESFNMNFK